MLKTVVRFTTFKKDILSNSKKMVKRFVNEENGDAVAVIIGIVTVIMIAAFVTIPALRAFATTMTTQLTAWWSTVKDTIMPTT
jgi:Flp pilus assembly pilin Flp